MAPRFVTCVQPTYSLTHTHTDTHTHRKHASPPPNNKSNLWYLGSGSGERSSEAARWHREAATSEWDVTSAVIGVNGSDEAKNTARRRECVCCQRLNECTKGFAMNGHTMSWMVMRDMWQPKRFVNVCALLYWGRPVCEHARMKQIAQMIQFKCDFWWRLLPDQSFKIRQGA